MKHLAWLFISLVLSLFSTISAGLEEISGSSYCKQFTPERVNILENKTDIISIRELRDLYMDCDVGKKYFEKALYYAELAAKMSHEIEDKKIYSLLVKASANGK